MYIEIGLVPFEALLKNGSTQKFIAKRYQTTEANLHHFLKQRGLARTTA
jgi:transcriptional regulator